MKIAVCQMKIEDNKVDNINKAANMIREAMAQEIDMAVLPEMFNIPYDTSRFASNAESEAEGETVHAMSALAKELGIYIVAGTIPEKAGEKICNTSFVFDRIGKIVGKHRKAHLYDIDIPDKIQFRESDSLAAGDSYTLFDTEFGRIGLAICYDIRFPEFSRIMALEGAKVMILPAAFNMTTGPAHWELLMRARAMDNQFYVVAASPARDIGAKYVVYGHSMVVEPWGTVVAKANESQDIIYAEVDFAKVDEVRQNMPFIKHMRKDIYSLNYAL